MKKILLALALVCLVSAPARAQSYCDTQTGAILLPVPAFDTSGFQWFDCMRNSFLELSTSVALSAPGSSSTFHIVYLDTITALVSQVVFSSDVYMAMDLQLVGTLTLPDGAIVSAFINTGAVTTAKLGTDAVTTAKVIDGAITTPKLASDAVTEVKILDGVVTTPKLGDGSVTDSKVHLSDLKLINTSLGARRTIGITQADNSTTPDDLYIAAGDFEGAIYIENGASVFITGGDGTSTRGNIILAHAGTIPRGAVGIRTDVICDTCTALHVGAGNSSFAGSVQIDGALILIDGAVTTDMLGGGVVTTSKLGDDLVLAPYSITMHVDDGDFSVQGSGARSLRLGIGAIASADDATCIGDDTDCTAIQTTGIGRGVQVTANECIAIGTSANCSAIRSIVIGRASSMSGTNSVSIGRFTTVSADACIAIGAQTDCSFIGSTVMGLSARANATNQFIVGSPGSRITHVYFDGGTHTPTTGGVTLHSSSGSTSNVNGGNFTIAPGEGTGTGTGGNFIIRTAPAGSSGPAPNALIERFRIDEDGKVGISEPNPDVDLEVGAAGAGTIHAANYDAHSSRDLKSHIRTLKQSDKVAAYNDLKTWEQSDFKRRVMKSTYTYEVMESTYTGGVEISVTKDGKKIPVIDDKQPDERGFIAEDMSDSIKGNEPLTISWNRTIMQIGMALQVAIQKIEALEARVDALEAGP